MTSFSLSASARRLSRSWRGFKRPLRRTSRRVAPALEQWLSPSENPFLARALRIEGRAHKPLATLGAVAVAIALALWGAWWLWTTFGISITGAAAPDALPRALGSHPVGFFAALTLTISLLSALGATRARAAALLRRELLGNTLDGLQMLPTGEERWVWWMSAQPFVLSLLIGLIGLPIYVLAVFTGVWRPLDLLGIALLFTLCGLVTPSWQPQLWQQQAARKAGKKVGAVTAAGRKGRSAPVTPTPVAPTPAATDAAAENAQSTLSGPDEAPTNDTRLAALKGELSKNTSGFRNGNWSWFYVWIAIQSFGGSFRLLRGNTGIALFWHNFSSSLPSSVTDLVGGGSMAVLHLALNWPLVVERTLLAPLPFFARSLPPMLLILPFLLAWRHQQTVGLASNVSGFESFWNARRLRLKREIGVALWSLTVLIVFGFGWQTLVTDGALHVALRGAPWGLSPTADWSLVALWTLCLVAATLLSASALEGLVRGATAREKFAESMELGTLRQFWQLMARSVARLLIGAVVIYFLMCWMGGANPINAAWRGRLALTSATCAAFVLADFGSGALQTAVAPDLRPTIRSTRILWFWGLPALIPLMLVVNWIRSWSGSGGIDFSFVVIPLAGLSPTTSLLGLLRYDLSFPGGPWWPLIAQAVIGAICFGVAHSLEERQRAAQPLEAPPQPIVEESGTMERLLSILWWPFATVGAVLRWLFSGVLWLFLAIINGVRRANEMLVTPFARWNNPVLSDELKRRLNREWWIVQWLAIGLGALTLFVLVTAPWTWPVGGLGFSGLTLVAIAGTGAILSSLAGLMLGRSLDRERANGTLIFLFLTPLTEREILIGKLIPTLIYGAASLLLMLPWLILGVVVDVLNGGSAATPSTPAIAAGLLATAIVQWLFTVGVAILCAVRARRPNDGVAYAFLAVFGIEIAMWAGLFYLTRWFGVFDNIRSTNLPIIILCGVGAFLLLLAWMAWRGALHSLRGLRYNDQTQRAKGAS